jgi:hypothetical protein
VRRLAAALLGGVLLAGCGSSASPAVSALRDTAKKLDDVRSARLDLKLSAESPAARGPVGFALRGPFALPDKAGLPVADLQVTELRGARTVTSRFVSTGQQAYVVRDGHVMSLPGGGGVTVGGDGGGLGSLRIDHWLRDPKVSDGGDVGGTETDHVTAGLDVATAFDDLGRLGERLGTSALAGLRPLDARSKAALAKAASHSSIEVWTGKKDRLLRRLVLHVTLAAGDKLPATLRSMAPVTLSLSLDLSAVNEPVHVDPPGES